MSGALPIDLFSLVRFEDPGAKPVGARRRAEALSLENSITMLGMSPYSAPQREAQRREARQKPWRAWAGRSSRT
jgi:hypothetical protein